MKNLKVMLKRTLLVLAVTAVLSSCNTYIQLFETTSSGKDEVVDQAFDNGEIRIDYNMWTDRGIMYFSVYNNTDKPMYIDWKRSVYVYNSWKYNYWEDKEVSQDYIVQENVNGQTFFNRRTSTVRVERVTFIPPRTYIRVPTAYFILDGEQIQESKDQKGNKINYTFTTLRNDKAGMKEGRVRKDKIQSTTGKGKTKVWIQEYTKENSRDVYRNFLTYADNEAFKNEKYVENEFYVSKVTEMTTKNFLGKSAKVKVTVKKGGKKAKATSKVYDSPYKKGTSFYKVLMPM